MNETLENIFIVIGLCFLIVLGVVWVVVSTVFLFINRHPWPVAAVIVAVIGFISWEKNYDRTR